MTEQTSVIRNNERSRYEIRVDDQVAGFSSFRVHDEVITLTHTQIDDAFGGRGLGTILVGETLKDLARRGDVVVPRCTFVAAYLKDHDVPGLVLDWPDEDDAAAPVSPGEHPG